MNGNGGPKYDDWSPNTSVKVLKRLRASSSKYAVQYSREWNHSRSTSRLEGNRHIPRMAVSGTRVVGEIAWPPSICPINSNTPYIRPTSSEPASVTVLPLF